MLRHGRASRHSRESGNPEILQLLERLDSRLHGNDRQELTRLHGCGQAHGEAGRTFFNLFFPAYS